ncbi:MAG: SUF system Fe-S cluster assembly regulator [Chthonomonadales bacterium]
MIRLTKLTDYGIVLMTHVACAPAGCVHNVPDLARRSQLPPATVSKILKALVRGGLLVSQRGAKGGYRLARDPGAISLADILQAMGGPIAITECGTGVPASCDYSVCCPVRLNLQRVNHEVRGVLERVSLAQMTRPAGAEIAFAPWAGQSRSGEGAALGNAAKVPTVAAEA